MKGTSERRQKLLIEKLDQPGKYQLDLEVLLNIDIIGSDIIKMLSRDLGIEDSYIESILFFLSDPISNCYVSSCTNRIPELVELLKAFQALSEQSIKSESGATFTMPQFHFEIPEIIFEKVEEEKHSRKTILSKFLNVIDNDLINSVRLHVSSNAEAELTNSDEEEVIMQLQNVLPLGSMLRGGSDNDEAADNDLINSVRSHVISNAEAELTNSNTNFQTQQITIETLDDLFSLFNQEPGAFQEVVLRQIADPTEEQTAALAKLDKALKQFADKNPDGKLSEEEMEMLRNNGAFMRFIEGLSQALPTFLKVTVIDESLHKSSSVTKHLFSEDRGRF